MHLQIRIVCSLVILSSLLGASVVSAFDLPVDSLGPITAQIVSPSEVNEINKPFSISVKIENKEDNPVEGTVKIGVIDDWVAEPSDLPFILNSKGDSTLEFTITPGTHTYNALYPIHAYINYKLDNKECQLHPILILQANIPDPPKPNLSVPWKPYEIHPDSAISLNGLQIYRVVLRVFGEGPQIVAVGNTGSDMRTKACWYNGGKYARGDIRRAIEMHPPWFNNLTGTIYTEFPIKLPEKEPITLKFANAIRDNVSPEPPSDGVTFRVRILPFSAPDGDEGEIVYEKHTTAKVWEEGEVDLSRFAGQTIRIQLESHPGPQNNTTCDHSYWGEPILTVGTPAQRGSFPPSMDTPSYSLGVIKVGNNDYEIKIWEGKRGILDSIIGFISSDKHLFIDGFKVKVLNDDLNDLYSVSQVKDIQKSEQDKHLIYKHSFSNWLGDFDLLSDIWIENNSLRVKFWLENIPEPQPWFAIYLEDVSLGKWSEHASKIYAGAGNILVEPDAFNLWFDGHQLSTSFVGFDFANDLSIVEGVDAVPQNLEVTPENQIYTLHTPHTQTISIIPSENSWEGAKIWRNINHLSPAGGVQNLAGRFVFDLWGGKYKESAENLERSFLYGLTDSIVVFHNWQRWGYDYRLPDICPPNPKFGTIEDFLYLVETCKKHGVLFAPHDNYIDFYPDAEGYSYNKIVFTQERTPIKAWYNASRQAQAYRWRPDQIFPSIERNLKLIKDGFSPTAYFIDVWSSTCPHDYWTDDGNFYTRLYTIDVWRKSFEWIRNFLGNNASQISESGHDQLIGWLDGAQANHLRVDIPPSGYYGWAVWAIHCKDSERIPWFDTAHHSKFVLHGAGYESRYSAGLDTRLHGIYSDDYICTEVLTGHPAMVPAPFGRDVIRKYWLLHDIMQTLALKEIDNVQFIDSDIHKQFIKWDNGAEIWVNRGNDDWQMEGRTLPQYGLYTRIPTNEGTIETAIERKDGVIVDWSRSPSTIFVNARPLLIERVPIRVKVSSLKYKGNRQADIELQWEAEKPLSEEMSIFVHFVDGTGNITFQSGNNVPIPTTQWQGTITSSGSFFIPENIKVGEEFEIRAGLFNPTTGARAQLSGFDDGTVRIRLGKIRLEGDGDNIQNITFTPIEGEDPILAKLNLHKKMIDFGDIITNGAARLTHDENGILITPLPDSPQFEMRLLWDKLPWQLKKVEMVEELDDKGNILSNYNLQWENNTAVFTIKPGVFAYRLK